MFWNVGCCDEASSNVAICIFDTNNGHAVLLLLKKHDFSIAIRDNVNFEQIE